MLTVSSFSRHMSSHFDFYHHTAARHVTCYLLQLLIWNISDELANKEWILFKLNLLQASFASYMIMLITCLLQI